MLFCNYLIRHVIGIIDVVCYEIIFTAVNNFDYMRIDQADAVDLVFSLLTF